jgi:hypothetical protein
MAGMPKRRARRESEARQAIADKAASTKAEMLPMHTNTKYSQELAGEIISLVASGVPMDDTLIGADIAVKGIASRVGVSPGTIYSWQKKYPDFDAAIRTAREESAHRFADQIVSLAGIAMDNPAMANATRVAGDLLKWSAMVRNRQYYSESKRIDIDTPSDLGDRLRRAGERMSDSAEINVKNGCATVMDVMELIDCGRAVVLVDGSQVIPQGVRLIEHNETRASGNTEEITS